MFNLFAQLICYLLLWDVSSHHSVLYWWKLCKDEGHCGILVFRRGRGNKKDLRHVIENHIKAILTLDYALEGSHKSRIVIIVICYCCSKKISKRGTWMCILTRFHTNKTNDRRRAQQKQQRNSCRCKFSSFS